MGQKTLEYAMKVSDLAFGFRAVMSIANAQSEALRLPAFDVILAKRQTPQARNRTFARLIHSPRVLKTKTNGVTNHG